MIKTVNLYFLNENQLDKDMLESLKIVCKSNELVFIEQCIDEDSILKERYSLKTPLVVVGPYQLNWPFTIKEVEVAVNAANYHDQIDNQETPSQRIKNRIEFTNTDRFALWFSKSYVWFISTFLLLFIAIPFLAPIFYLVDKPKTANSIYRFYSILCHQLAYRSFFLSGVQPYYPRELAGLDSELTYEKVTGVEATDLEFARKFIGNEYLGYKIAICERDIAIYGSLALFGIFFQLSGKKLKSLHWFLWLIIALFPIALDGFSQLPGLTMGLPAWLPIRESTPFLRVFTGTLFGGGTAWYMFPLMEESMKETRFQLSRKRMIVQKLAGMK